MNKKIGLLVCVAIFTGLALLTPPTVNVFAKESNAQRDSSGNNQHDGENEKKNKNEIHATGSTLEVHIFDSGMVLVRGAKVTAVSGSTVSASTAFGLATLSWTVTSDANTNLLRRSGGMSTLSEISVGDFISFQGPLEASSGALTVHADTLKNWSVQKKNVSFIGKVASVGVASFSLTTDKHGQVTVNVVGSVSISKGDSAVTFSDVHVGDKVSVGGVFDEVSKILTASKVKLYVDKTSEQHVFEGTLKAISGTTQPASFTLALGEGAVVTVIVPVGVSVVGRTYLGVSLADFRVGDTVRVWGLREGSTVDATVVRNVKLPR